ncbi:preprotein translocase subunit SecG, partial [Pseudomonas atacamensis]
MSSVRSVAPRETENMLETVVVVFHLLGAFGVVGVV